MAIFHLSVKCVSRSAGRSATGAAAYRAGARIVDARTGVVHDYERKRGIEAAGLVLPEGAPEWAANRSALWNAAEAAEVRRNATVARELVLALPAELDAAGRQRLAVAMARELAGQHQVAVDVAIHAPVRGGDDRNHHAHLLLTTRRLVGGRLAEKSREWDDRADGPRVVSIWRERWAALMNAALARAQKRARVDHRSLRAQGVARMPTWHLGPAVVGVERRRGVRSRVRREMEATVASHDRQVQLEAAELAQDRQDERQTEGELAQARADVARGFITRATPEDGSPDRVAKLRDLVKRATGEAPAPDEPSTPTPPRRRGPR